MTSQTNHCSNITVTGFSSARIYNLHTQYTTHVLGLEKILEEYLINSALYCEDEERKLRSWEVAKVTSGKKSSPVSRVQGPW